MYTYTHMHSLTRTHTHTHTHRVGTLITEEFPKLSDPSGLLKVLKVCYLLYACMLLHSCSMCMPIATKLLFRVYSFLVRNWLQGQFPQPLGRG